MSEKTMIEAIRECLGQEMAADNRVVVIGEDVGVLGGVFRATASKLHACATDPKVGMHFHL